MSINDFLTKGNVDLLWEVIIDDELFKNKPKELINQIGNMFAQNLRGFNESEKNNSNNLVNMNKKFIELILNRSYSIINFNKNPIPPQKQKELITSTDLLSDRMSQFEKELSQKQTEFTNAMSLPVPPVPKFSDNNLDGPMGEMDLAIKKALEQRNYDIEQLNKTLSKSNQDSSWLKSQETSVKSEKIIPLNNVTQKSNISNVSKINSSNLNTNTLKYIKIDEETIENNIIKKDIIDLNQKKHITWKDENISLQIVDETKEQNDINKDKVFEDNSFEDSIFKKLKKITPQTKNVESNNVESLNINIINIINNRMNILEDKLEGLNNKVDLIIKLLQK
jgi:hypothetical protein